MKEWHRVRLFVLELPVDSLLMLVQQCIPIQDELGDMVTQLVS
jgi:hypothetical protein